MNDLSNKVAPIVFWVIWFALLSGVIVMTLFIPAPEKPLIPGIAGTPIWLLAVVPLAISALIRWLVLPRAANLQAALPVFIIGMALAESAAIAGLLVFPDRRIELIVLGMIGIAQFAPVFVARFSEEKGR
jgi:hypothetical protein